MRETGLSIPSIHPKWNPMGRTLMDLEPKDQIEGVGKLETGCTEYNGLRGNGQAQERPIERDRIREANDIAGVLQSDASD